MPPKRNFPYGRQELFSIGPRLPYKKQQLHNIAFPLGGIGAGMVSLGGWGQLRDWEIRNRPAKGFLVPFTFFTLRVEQGKKPPLVRVIQGPVGGSYAIGGGHSSVRPEDGAGLPRFREVSFTGEFPVATLRFKDQEVPLEVSLEAFNPFLPLNDRDSSLPVAILSYTLRNRTKKSVSFSLIGNLSNIVGHPEREGRTNKARRERGLNGLYLTTNKYAPDSLEFGSMALATPWNETTIWPRWRLSPGCQLPKFWEVVAWSPKLPMRMEGSADTGSVAARGTLKPGEKVTIPFVIAWHFPIFEHWEKPADGSSPARWRNYYATQWQDAWEVARYTLSNFDRLREETLRFHDALFSSTLPTQALDAISSQLSVLKSPTCLRLEDGTFYGFEGCSDTAGCCQGSCTHVWNYAQSLPYLFPTLQRSLREAEYKNSLLDDGFMCFRMPLPLGAKGTRDYHPAADGQLGTVLQVYRDWLISGDDDWLKSIWPCAKRALEFAWRYWDADRDGVIEGMQHNTYDTELHGPNTMIGSLYLGALRAAEEMARYLGEEAKAEEYHRLFVHGSKWTDAHLFNGEYYEQRVNPKAREVWPDNLRKLSESYGQDDKVTAWPKCQYGKGCLSDQLLGQWYAMMLGLGHLYDKRRVRRALQSVFRYNWRSDLSQHPGLFRLYALDEEAGLIITTWPKGGRPGETLWYADEVWCGIEYQVAAHLIYEGLVAEGLAIVKGVRDRHDGIRRNPWDEFECGHHYARSMASYSLLLALSGFSYSGVEKHIGFDPRMSERDFQVFFCVGSGWGSYSQKLMQNSAMISLKLEVGTLELKELRTAIKVERGVGAVVTIGRRRTHALVKRASDGMTLIFETPVMLSAGETLKVQLH